MRLALLILLTVFSAAAQVTNQPAVNVVAWGDNSSGQTNVPPDLTNAIAVAAGSGFSLALRADGTVVEWGATNYSGGIPRPSLSNVVSIAAGGGSRAAVLANGTCALWGPCATPVPPPILTNVIKILPDDSGYVALTAQGILMPVPTCPPNFGYATPPGGSNYIGMSVGGCCIFGLNSDGTVAEGGFVPSCVCDLGCFHPWLPGDVTNAIDIAASGTVVAALRSDGSLAGGTVYTLNQYNPYPLTGYSNVVAIFGGPGGVIALRGDGTAVGVSPVGYGTPLSVPPDLPYATAFAVGDSHYLALVHPGVPVYPPAIVQQPLSQTVPINGTVSLYAAARGFPPLGYTWFFNQTNTVPGANYPFLTLTNVQPQQSGSYTIVVTNSVGAVTSAPAMLLVASLLDVKIVPAVYLTGGIGFTYRLDYINAIGPPVAWTNLAVIVITNQPQIYFDLSAIGQPQRFYRLVQVP